jgi:hypothetical protein
MRRDLRRGTGFAAAIFAIGVLSGCSPQGPTSYNEGSAVKHAQSVVDQQIKDVQDSKYLTPEQKEARVAQIRAMNAKLGQKASQGH